MRERVGEHELYGDQSKFRWEIDGNLMKKTIPKTRFLLYVAIVLALVVTGGLTLTGRVYFDALASLREQRITYSAFMGQVLVGKYHAYLDAGEWVFYLISSNITFRTVRLIFYCENRAYSSAGRWSFCTDPTQIPLAEGHEATLRGTLLCPSGWKTELSDQHMNFDADLYVITIL